MKKSIILYFLFGLSILSIVSFANPIERNWYKGENTTDNGTLALDLTAGSQSQYGAGKLNNAFMFNNSVQSTFNRSGNSADNFGTGEFSVSFWYNGSASNGKTLIQEYASTHGWQIYVDTGGILEWYGENSKRLTGTSKIDNGVWQWILFQKEADGKLYLYINNTNDTTAGVSITDNYNTNPEFRISGVSGQEIPAGAKIDDVRIFNVSLNSTQRALLWNNGTGYNYSLNYTAPSGDVFNITINEPGNTTYHYPILNLSLNVTGNNATYSCWYSVNGTNSSNFSVTNNTLYNTNFSVLNGTHTLIANCTNGSISYVKNVSFTNILGVINLQTHDDSTNNYTIANITSVLVYNSSSTQNFTGNNFSWSYTSLPGGNVTIIVSYANVTRETNILVNSTNYYNITITFPVNTQNYNFLVQNIYSSAISGASAYFYYIDGTFITSRESQSDGYIYEIYLTKNLPVIINLTKEGFASKSIDFTPYESTNLPVIITMEASATETPKSALEYYITTSWYCYLKSVSSTDNRLNCSINGTYLSNACLYITAVNNTMNLSTNSSCAAHDIELSLGSITGSKYFYIFYGNYSNYTLQLETGEIDRTTSTSSQNYGKFGLFLTMILFITASFIGISFAPAGIFLGLLVLCFSVVFGMVDIGTTALMSIICIGVILAYGVGKK